MESLSYKLILIVSCLSAWYISQRWINTRGFPKDRIGDLAHRILSPIHKKLHQEPNLSSKLLITSSLIIDIIGVSIIVVSLFGPTMTPFISLMILFIFRQISQGLCSLPAPQGMIWKYPGFPSLFVTYETTNDFFFSGHTAIAVLGAILAYAFAPWYIVLLAVVVAIFEALTVLVLKAHYTMDIIAAIFAAGCSYALAKVLNL